MKLASALFILGASSASAASLQADEIAHFVSSTGTAVQIKQLTNTKLKLEKGEGTINCAVAGGDGSAFPTYGDFVAATATEGTEVDIPVTEVLTGSTMGYICGVKDADGNYMDVAASGNDGLTFRGNSVLVVVDGTCTTGTDTEEVTAISQVSDNSYVPNKRAYVPTVTASRTYKCIQEKTHTVSTTATLNYEKKDDVDNIVDDQTLESTALTLSTTTDGKVFSGSTVLSFDVGVDLPHDNYFKDLQGCGALCKGSLVISADSKNSSHASFFTTAYNSLATYYKFEPCVSSGVYFDENGTFTRSGIYTMATVCDAPLERVSGPLNTKLECPYKKLDLNSSTLEDKDLCLSHADDADENGENTCEKNRPGTQVTIGEGSRFFVTVKYVDGNVKTRFGDVSKCTLSATSDSYKDLGSEIHLPEVEFNCTENVVADENSDLHGATNFFLEGKNSLGNVTFRRDIADVEVASAFKVKIPTTHKNDTFTLRAMYRVECNLTETDMSTPVSLPFSRNTKTSGSFVIAGNSTAEKNDNICRKRFKFTATDNSTYGDGSHSMFGTDAFVCTSATQTNEDCRAMNVQLLKDGDNVYLPTMCDDIRDQDLGGLIDFDTDDMVAATVICSGVCGRASLYGLALDWTDELVASTVKNDNRLEVSLGSSWSDDRKNSAGDLLYTAAATAYIGATDDCLVDGRMATPEHSIASECRANTTEGNTSYGKFFQEQLDAAGMVDLFKTCGDTLASSPSLFLNQQFTIDYTDSADGTDARYCNSKKLTIGVEEMSGQVTAAMTVQQEAGGAFALTATLGTVVMKKCEVGGELIGHQIEVNVELEAPSFVDMAHYENTESSLVYGEDDVKNDTSIVWRTACVQVCGEGASVPGSWQKDQTLKSNVNLTDTTDEDASSVVEVVETSVRVLGSPCESSDTIEAGSVSLTMHKGKSTDATCISNNTDLVSPDDSICGILKIDADFADSRLRITSHELTRLRGDEEEVHVPTGKTALNPVFHTNETSVLHGNGTEVRGDFVTDTNDAGATFRLIVNYEQDNSAERRRLRSTFLFGAGDAEVRASIKVLPASVEITDELEAGEDSLTNPENVPAPSKQDQRDYNTYTTQAVIITACSVALLIVIVVVISRICKVKDRKGSSYGSKLRKVITGSKDLVEMPEYSKLRRNERFTIKSF